MPAFHIEPVKASAGLPNAKIVLGDKSVTLHSIAPYKEAERIADKFNKDLNWVLLIGFGMGYIAEYFLNKTNYKVLVYEPLKEIFKYAQKERNLDSIINNNRLKFFDGNFQSVLDFLQENGIKELNFYIHRPYSIINPAEISSLEGLLIAYISRRNLNLATIKRFQKTWLRNIIKNFPLYFRRPGIKHIRHSFQEKPAVIVGAGPSLVKNIEYLKEIQNNLLIISTDTALPMLTEAGIKADFAVSVDPQDKNALYLAYTTDKSVPVVMDAAASFLTHRLYPEDKIILCDTIFPMYEAFQSYWGTKGKLMAGGSVSTTAFDFARYLGASPILFIGQDLAYSKRLTHYQASALEEFLYYRADRFQTVEDYNSRMLLFSDKIEVEGISGKVLTDRKFVTFRDWFQREIKNTAVPVINSTEGGAVITGAQHIPLKEAAVKYKILTPIEKQFTLQYQPQNDSDFKKELSCFQNSLDLLIPKAVKARLAAKSAEADYKNGKNPGRWFQEMSGFDTSFQETLNSGNPVARFLEFTMQETIEFILDGRLSNVLSAEMLNGWVDFYSKASNGLLSIKRLLKKVL